MAVWSRLLELRGSDDAQLSFNRNFFCLRPRFHTQLILTWRHEKVKNPSLPPVTSSKGSCDSQVYEFLLVSHLNLFGFPYRLLRVAVCLYQWSRGTGVLISSVLKSFCCFLPAEVPCSPVILWFSSPWTEQVELHHRRCNTAPWVMRCIYTGKCCARREGSSSEHQCWINVGQTSHDLHSCKYLPCE